MNSKFYVSLEVARLLKEKGYNNYSIVYDCSVKGSILLNQQPMYGEWAGDKDIYPCPTKAEAIDWLESKGIVITVEYINGLWDCQIYSFVDGTILHGKALPMVYDVVNFQTRLEAEEGAIIKALEML